MPDLYELLSTIVTNLIGVGLGLLLILAARKRWAFLVNPPESLWFLYSQSLITKLSGSKGAVIFCYAVGSLLILLAGIQALEGVLLLGQGLGYW